jgi:hypothetical protein
MPSVTFSLRTNRGCSGARCIVAATLVVAGSSSKDGARVDLQRNYKTRSGVFVALSVGVQSAKKT